MSHRGDADESREPVRVGLCERCRHVHVVENRRGSRFYRCVLAEVDARFPKYPRLPVVRCEGFVAER